MSKGVKLITAATCLLGAVILIALLPARSDDPSNDPQPSYNGKKLSAWVADLLRGKKEGPRAVDAILAIGTNGAPCLFKWMTYKTPGWRQTLSAAATKAHFTKPKALTVDKREEFAEAAYTALMWLAGRYPEIATEAQKLLSDPNTPRITRNRAQFLVLLRNQIDSPPPPPGDLNP
jgi:hypothetical protein